jgi:lactam utilization protein B
MKTIHFANIACGFHASYVTFRMDIGILTIVISDSDFNIMNKTVELAKQNGVKVGAHPSLPDLQGFGRREMAIEPVSFVKRCPQVEFLYVGLGKGELTNCFMYQVGALSGFLKLHGLPMSHVSLQCYAGQSRKTHRPRSNHTAQSTDNRLALSR